MSKTIMVAGVFLLLNACASHPDRIEAVRVPPEKYADHGCEQLEAKMADIAQRTAVLYQRIKSERVADGWKAAFGVVLLTPALFSSDTGDGADAVLYARLKGEFEALRANSEQKNCGHDIKSPEETVEELYEQDKSASKEAEDA